MNDIQNPISTPKNQFSQPPCTIYNELNDDLISQQSYEIKRKNTMVVTEMYNKIPDSSKLLSMQNIYVAYMKVRKFVTRTPIKKSILLSERYKSNIYYKREDQQIVKSYKIRGVYNKIYNLKQFETVNGIVSAGAGDHATAVAYVCNQLKIKCTIFLQTSTPQSKINVVQDYGKEWVELKIKGDSLEEVHKAAQLFASENNRSWVHPFDDQQIIEGAATVGLEILEDFEDSNIDYLFFPIGGGGIGAGLCSVFKQISSNTILIGCEPLNSPSLKMALQAGEPVDLPAQYNSSYGCRVRRTGKLNFSIMNEVLNDVCLVPEGQVCSVMIQLFNEEGILVEHPGALAAASLEQFKDCIRGKNVVVILSGSNNDIEKMTDIRMLSEMHEGLQYYLLVNFYQKPRALKEFFSECLGPTDEITNIEYTKKNNREKGPALVGIKVQSPNDFECIKKKMLELNITFKFLNPEQEIFKLLV